MQPALRQLVDCVKATNFEGIRKVIELKILALLYFFGLSPETSNFLSLFEEISHESVSLKATKKGEKKVNSNR